MPGRVCGAWRRDTGSTATCSHTITSSTWLESSTPARTVHARSVGIRYPSGSAGSPSHAISRTIHHLSICRHPHRTTAPRAISYSQGIESTVDGSSTNCLSMCGITTPSHGRSRHVRASHPLSGGTEDVRQRDLTSSLHREQTSLGRRAKQSTA
jgi:hypothetical protein